MASVFSHAIAAFGIGACFYRPGTPKRVWVAGAVCSVIHPAYTQIAEDYERMWRVLKSLPWNIFLGAHGSYFGLEEKYHLRKEDGANPFVDPDGYKRFITQ
jgi:hypothetical protein